VADDPDGPDRPPSASAGPGRGNGPGGQGTGSGGSNGNGGSSGDGPPPGQSLRVVVAPQSPGLLEAILGSVAGFFFGS
jgi:hypothetical protein